MSIHSVRIDQVVANLVDHALEYTPAGKRIDITVAAREGRAILEAPEAMPPTAQSKERRFMEILIVEDNADARDSLVALLELSGHRVAGADSGTAALEAIRVSIPQLALVDIGLPDIDGFALARAIRALEGGRTIRLIALTGYGSPEDQERAIASGFDAHLIKPLDLDALEKMLQRMENEA